MDAEKAREIDLRTVISLDGEKDYGHYKSGYCPFHESDGHQHHPSFAVYKSRYKCYSTNCDQRGDIFNWYSWKMYGNPINPLRDGHFKDVLSAIFRDFLPFFAENGNKNEGENGTKKPKKDGDKTLLALAEAYHETLLKAPKRVAYFLSRGFGYGTILRQMWGWDGRHYTVPVWSSVPRKSRILSIRMRSAVEGDVRYSGIKGSNDKVLYNREALLVAKKIKSKFFFIFYGEFDAQLAWQDGLPSASPTNGALSFDGDWFEDFAGEKIFVPDIGEDKAAIEDAGQFGDRGWVVHLPTKKSLKDYTDFRTKGNLGICDLIRDVFLPQIPVLSAKDVVKTVKKCLSCQV